MSSGPSTDPIAIIESINLRSLSDWLLLDIGYINMTQVQSVRTIHTNFDQVLKLQFVGELSEVVRGADRLKVLAWLAEQVSPEPGTPPA